MLTLNKIDHIHVQVRNRTSAASWYQRVLGFTHDLRFKHHAAEPGGPLMLMNASGTIRLALFERPEMAPSRDVIAFATSGQELLAWADTLAGERVKDIEGETIARDSLEDFTFYYSIAFCDPDGNRYEIVSYDYTWLSAKLKKGLKTTV